MKNNLTAGPLTARPGEKTQGFLSVPDTGVSFPVTLVNGAGEGPTLAVIAGLHSGEYPGVAAVIETAARLDPAQLSGQLLLIHCLNTPGFFVRADAIVPEDGRNLLSAFPGSPAGTLTERMAHVVAEAFLRQADFVVDLHSGGVYEPLADCLFYPAGAGEAVQEASLAAAAVLDIPYHIVAYTTAGPYTWAALSGIPGLLLERGGAGACEGEKVAAFCRDLHNLMVHLGLLSAPLYPVECRQHNCREAVYLCAPAQGLWYPAVSPGQRVRQGACLGELRDFFGGVLHRLTAEQDGTVFYLLHCLAVREGEGIVAYGR